MSCCKKDQCCKSQRIEKIVDEQDYLVCTCMGVMKSEIEEAIYRGVDTFDGLSDELGVGTGCTTCVQEVLEIMKKSKQKCCSKD